MNTNPASTVNTAAVAAVIAIFLLLATLFGAPSGQAAAGPDPASVSLHVNGE